MDWSFVSCGDSHTVAIKMDGTLWVWGYNTYGQLGLGDTTNRFAPTRVDKDTYYEPNNSTSTAYGPLVSGTTYYGYIWDVDDNDYYKFYISRPSSVTVKLFNLPQNYDLYLYDGNGTTLIASSYNDSTFDEYITASLTTANTYYIWIDPRASYDRNNLYSLVLTIKESSLNYAPTLSFLGISGYTDDGVEPNTGYFGAKSVSLVFRVKYTDIDNDSPNNIYLNIKYPDKSFYGESYIMTKEDSLNNNYSSGAVYISTITPNISTGFFVTRGTYHYYFSATDVNGNSATGDPTNIDTYYFSIDKIYKIEGYAGHSNANVSIESSTTTIYLISDSNGYFSKYLPLGYYNIHFYLNGYFIEPYSIMVTQQNLIDTENSGSSYVYSIVYNNSDYLPSISSFYVSGYIYDENYNSLIDVTVYLRDSDNSSILGTYYSFDGSYIFNDLPSDRDFYVTASKSGYTFDDYLVLAGIGENQNIVATSGGTGYTISGTVYDFNYNGVDALEIRCYKISTGGDLYATTWTNSSGNYTLTIRDTYETYKIVPYDSSLRYEYDAIEIYLDNDYYAQDFYPRGTGEVYRPDNDKFVVGRNVISKGSGNYMAIRTNPQGAGTIKVKIYTLSGRLVNEWDQYIDPTNPDFSWDGRDNRGDYLPHGVYYIVIEGNGINDKRTVIIKGK